MRKILILLLAIFVVGAYSADVFAQDHAFIGAKKCGMCHKGEKKGMILEKWEEGPHAKAYETLATDEAKAIATEKGLGNPQEAAECLKCHVTGHGMDASLTADLDMANGISCEACHGAGADYKSMKIMKDREASIAAGMVAAPKEGCVSCHNEESPTYKPFVLEEYWAEIEHGLPEGE
ncbi:cytochrome C554 [bacterium]|nr:cytochrome C554 [bacterium]